MNKPDRESPIKHSCQVCFQLVKWFQRRRLKLTYDDADDGRKVMTIAQMVLRTRWAKNNVSIFIPIVAIWLWDLRNNNLFYNLLQFLTFVLNFHYLHIIYIEVRPLDKLAETYFFLLKTTQIWFITTVVVLDQSPVTFQKGGEGYYSLCGIRPKNSNI